jgi:hypothetical protein
MFCAARFVGAGAGADGTSAAAADPLVRLSPEAEIAVVRRMAAVPLVRLAPVAEMPVVRRMAAVPLVRLAPVAEMEVGGSTPPRMNENGSAYRLTSPAESLVLTVHRLDI